MRKVLIGIPAIIFSVFVTANVQQKQTQTVNQAWTGYFNQTRFSNEWGLWVDGQLRTKENFFEDLSQSIIRLGLTYYLTDAARLTAGYAYVNHFPADNHKNISQPEHRPWQQIQWHTKYARIRTMQWLRLEERYRRKIEDESHLAEGYTFNFRMRYNFFLLYPLSDKGLEPKTLSLVANNEVFFNFGGQIEYNYFDQNRFFLGVNYNINKHDNLQIGYMNVFQQLPAGSKYRSINVARIFFFHNLDLRGYLKISDWF